MTRKPSKTLTGGELRIMKVLWELEQASVSDVVAGLQHSRPATYKTTQSMLRILEDKGYVTHTKQSRSFVYSPLVNRREASLAATKNLLDHFFNSSPSSLVANLLEEEVLDAEDLDRLKSMIEKSDSPR